MSNTQSKPVSIKIITGSTRENRFSHKAATWIASLINEKENVDCEIIDLADYDMPFFNAPVSPAFKQEPYKNKAVARFTKKIDQADGFILVTPEYNHGTSGVLKKCPGLGLPRMAQKSRRLCKLRQCWRSSSCRTTSFKRC